MRRILLAAAAAAVLALPAAAQDVSTNPQAAPAGDYSLDGSHTMILFSVGHLGLSDYIGRFNVAEGSLTWSGTEPAKSALTVTIDTASLDTTSDALDGKLKDAKMFDVAAHPKATFTSTAIRVTGENTGEIDGNLTIKGVTKPVTLQTTFRGSRQHPFANVPALGFSATTTIKRSEFGLSEWLVAVTDEVELTLEAEFIKAGE